MKIDKNTRFRYDPDTDAIYIKLRDGEYQHTQEISDYVFIDIDVNGNVIGLEVLHAADSIDNLDRWLSESRFEGHTIDNVQVSYMSEPASEFSVAA